MHCRRFSKARDPRAGSPRWRKFPPSGPGKADSLRFRHLPAAAWTFSCPGGVPIGLKSRALPALKPMTRRTVAVGKKSGPSGLWSRALPGFGRTFHPGRQCKRDMRESPSHSQRGGRRWEPAKGNEYRRESAPLGRGSAAAGGKGVICGATRPHGKRNDER